MNDPQDSYTYATTATNANKESTSSRSSINAEIYIQKYFI